MRAAYHRRRRFLAQITRPRRWRLRVKHYSIRTEQAYVDWIRRFILFHHKRHPNEMREPEMKQNGSLGLMPHEELRYYTYLYDTISYVKSGLADCAVSLHKANAIRHRSPDGNLTPRDIEELITATSEAQANIDSVAAILHFEELGMQPIRR